jgi:hypothetical protein
MESLASVWSWPRPITVLEGAFAAILNMILGSLGLY